MRKQTIGLAGALMLCGISMLTGCGARGLEQAYSFQEREAQMTPAAGALFCVFSLRTGICRRRYCSR